MASDSMPRSSRRGQAAPGAPAPGGVPGRPGIPQGSPIRDRSASEDSISDADFSPADPTPTVRRPAGGTPGPGGARDNSSRFDD
jgi:hypothetical protein